MDEQENNSFMDEQENKKSGGKKGSLNPATNAAEKLKAAEKTTKQGAKLTGKIAEKQAGKKTGEVAAKLSAKLGKVSTQAGKAAQIAAKLSKVIATVGWIILLIIAIIGLLTFIITGLGLIMSGLKSVAEAFRAALVGFIAGKEEIVSENSIVDTLSYLEEMDYDLYGYGFSAIPNPLTEEKDEEGNVTKKSLTYPGNWFGDNPEFQKAYRNIRAYLVSDNYAYVLQHQNKTLKNILTFAPGNGLIGIYHDNGLGISQGEYSKFWDAGSIEIKNNKDLVINAGAFNTGVTMTYPLDGWIGRYGMPLEFLLSVHVATMAPDLSYKMATSFDTEVEILLHKVEGGQIDGAVGPSEDLIAPWSVFKGDWWDTSWNLNAEETKQILDNSNGAIKSYTGDDANYSKYKCTGPPQWDEAGKISRIDKMEYYEKFDASVKECVKVGEERKW